MRSEIGNYFKNQKNANWYAIVLSDSAVAFYEEDGYLEEVLYGEDWVIEPDEHMAWVLR